jgi:hypothetical protein
MSAWLRLPSLRALTARLRDINDAFKHPAAGAEVVYLFCEGATADGDRGCEWVVGCSPHDWLCVRPGELVPGNDTFDAVAAARRLLAAAKDAGFK